MPKCDFDKVMAKNTSGGTGGCLAACVLGLTYLHRSVVSTTQLYAFDFIFYFKNSGLLLIKFACSAHIA